MRSVDVTYGVCVALGFHEVGWPVGFGLLSGLAVACICRFLRPLWETLAGYSAELLCSSLESLPADPRGPLTTGPLPTGPLPAGSLCPSVVPVYGAEPFARKNCELNDACPLDVR